MLDQLAPRCPSCGSPAHYTGQGGIYECDSCGYRFDPNDSLSARGPAGHVSDEEYREAMDRLHELNAADEPKHSADRDISDLEDLYL